MKPVFMSDMYSGDKFKSQADYYNYMKVINEISNNITIFIIAHRLTTLKGCDRVIDLNKEMYSTSES